RRAALQPASQAPLPDPFQNSRPRSAPCCLNGAHLCAAVAGSSGRCLRQRWIASATSGTATSLASPPARPLPKQPTTLRPVLSERRTSVRCRGWFVRAMLKAALDRLSDERHCNQPRKPPCPTPSKTADHAPPRAV